MKENECLCLPGVCRKTAGEMFHLSTRTGLVSQLRWESIPGTGNSMSKGANCRKQQEVFGRLQVTQYSQSKV